LQPDARRPLVAPSAFSAAFSASDLGGGIWTSGCGVSGAGVIAFATAALTSAGMAAMTFSATSGFSIALAISGARTSGCC